MKIPHTFNFFVPQIIEKINSPINGEIRVVKLLGGTRIVVNNMLQSGGLVELIWKKGINKIFNYLASIRRSGQFSIINVLILGLGGGSAAQIINKKFPKAKIIGVEIDPQMIKLGKKYFGLAKIKNLKIIQANAIKYVTNNKTRFNLILVDLYLGDLISKGSHSRSFLRDLKKIISPKGLVIVNCLFYGEYKAEAEKVVKEVAKIFAKVNLIRSWSNLLVVCQG